MLFGSPQYADNNVLLNRKFAQNRVLICVHRGSSHGNIIQNTTLAYKAAIMQGADIVETDTTVSKDGVVFSFHDGIEEHLLKCDRNATKMTSAQIQAIAPVNAIGEPSDYHIQKLSDILDFLRHDELINIDRTWRADGMVLPLLDQYPHMARQAILKAPFRHRPVIDELNAHPVKYMFMPICYTMKDVEEILRYDALNLVGIELIARTPDDELFSDEAIKYIHSKNLFCWANAITLFAKEMKPDLFGGLDDDLSIREGPEFGWGKLIDKGIDVIQTDWPSILRDYRMNRFGV